MFLKNSPGIATGRERLNVAFYGLIMFPLEIPKHHSSVYVFEPKIKKTFCAFCNAKTKNYETFNNFCPLWEKFSNSLRFFACGCLLTSILELSVFAF